MTPKKFACQFKSRGWGSYIKCSVMLTLLWDDIVKGNKLQIISETESMKNRVYCEMSLSFVIDFSFGIFDLQV